MLRRVDNVTSSDAPLKQGQVLQPPSYSGYLARSFFRNASLEYDITRLAQGNTEHESTYAMYQRPLQYAKTCERHRPFAEKMGYLQTNSLSPFQEQRSPVERNIRLAGIATFTNDICQFKRYRRLVIEYLEMQYHRIFRAAEQLRQYVRPQEVISCSLQRPSSSDDIRSDDADRALVLSEEYAASFERDMSLEIKVRLKAFILRGNEPSKYLT